MPFKANYSFPAALGPPPSPIEKRKSEEKKKPLKSSKSQGNSIGNTSIQKRSLPG